MAEHIYSIQHYRYRLMGRRLQPSYAVTCIGGARAARIVKWCGSWSEAEAWCAATGRERYQAADIKGEG